MTVEQMRALLAYLDAKMDEKLGHASGWDARSERLREGAFLDDLTTALGFPKGSLS